MQPAFKLPSYAKINLGLWILGKRDDGFHELCTVFQTVSLRDELTFSASEDIRLTCSDPLLPTDTGNLVVKAAKALQTRASAKKGASIHLKKRIPAPGGLGGGSSNAAVTLLGLKKLWEIDISDGELHEIAAHLGSDVPFFLYGGTAIGTGRGEIIEPIDDIDIPFMLIVTPRIDVSTREAFASAAAENLTSEERNRILRVCRDAAGSPDLVLSALTNDLERSVFMAFPEIEAVKKTLISLGAAHALLSGSGASVFAIFEKQETRQAAIKALGERPTWRSFAVTTVSRSRYFEELVA